MKSRSIVVLSLLASCFLCSAQGPESWTFQPGVMARGQKPETWTLDLRGKTLPQAQAAARQLSSRLYGSSEPALHSPLIIKTEFPTQKTFAFQLAAVSTGGSDLVVKTNGAVFHRQVWPAAGATHRPNRIVHLPLPAGKAEVSIEITGRGGVVVIDRYFIADSPAQLPQDPPPLAFNSATIAPARPREKPPFTGDLSRPGDGYRGIWFTLGQFTGHGDKYSGGLGTYTANHIPIAVHAPAVNKTFFVYGGTIKDQRHLLIMASYYDHGKNHVPRPTIVHDKQGVNDPHDNASLALDDKGHIWVFISGRGRGRPGFKYRSKAPYSVAEFEFIEENEFTYPQPWFVPGKGFFHLFTKYTAGRELYWETSQDGVRWSEHQKLAGLEGHYQVSNAHQDKIGSFFNRHPGRSVDRRTDLYYVQTTDWGKTWTTVDGRKVPVPLENPDNPARVINYEAQGRMMYTIDLQFDRHGHPVLLYITSRGWKPGPENDPREWVITKWTGRQWETHVVCRSDHNYDLGSLFIGEKEWTIVGPTEPGPQPYGTGGEIAVWVSADEGRNWSKRRQVTRNSEFNHTYVRRVVDGKEPFHVLWADGDPGKLSLSRLYFGAANGRYWQLPYDMEGDFATPVEMRR